jgi:hypothetical protein
MKWSFLAFIVVSVLFLSGCAMHSSAPQSPETTMPAMSDTSEEKPVGLPDFYGPLGRNHRAMRPLEEAFRRVEAIRKAKRFTLSELKAISNTTSFSGVAISGCDLETLKAIVASDHAPVVVITSPVGPKHVRAVVGYDDPSGSLTLIDPVNLKQASQARLEYTDFMKQWDDPQKTCLLIFSDYRGESAIENILRKYLTEEKIDALNIMTSR